MKKFLIGLLVVLVLLVGGLAAFLYTLDVERYRDQIEAQATNVIGRQVIFSGPMSVSVWPSVAIAVEGITIANPSWTERRHMLSAGNIELSIALLPLLQRKLQIERVFLNDIDLALEETANGEKNWMLPFMAQPAQETQPVPLEGEEAGPKQLALDVSQVNLSNVRFSYRKARENQAPMVQELLLERVTIRAQEGERVTLDADMQYAGETINLGMRAGTLQELQAKTPFQASLTVTGIGTDLELQGEVDLSQGIAADMNLAMQGRRFADLARVMPGEPALPEGAPYRLVGRLQTVPNQYRLTDMLLEFAQTRVNGSVQVVMEDQRPTVTANLVSDAFYPADLIPPKGDPATDNDGRATGARTNDGAPVALPWAMLELADADVTLDIKAIQGTAAPIGNMAGRVRLKGGQLMAGPIQATVAGGNVNGTMTAESAGQFNVQLSGQAIDYGALLDAMGKTQFLEGRADFGVNLRGQGQTMDRVLSGLNGQILVDGGNGVLLSQYLEGRWLDRIREASPFPVDFERTVMNCMITKVTIENGLAEITETMLDTAAITVAATGRYAIGDDQLNMVMRARPNTGATGGLSAPLKLSGGIGDIKIRVDGQGLAQGLGDLVGVNLGGFRVPVVTNSAGGPEACRVASRQAASGSAPANDNGLRSVIDNATGGQVEEAIDGQLERLPEGAGEAVKGLFDRLTR
ncbi:MAG: AsmA family protein [Pseudomonadota bacterium]